MTRAAAIKSLGFCHKQINKYAKLIKDGKADADDIDAQKTVEAMIDARMKGNCVIHAMRMVAWSDPNYAPCG